MSKRNIGQELLEGVQQIKQGKGKRYCIEVPEDVSRIRYDLELSQAAFSALLGVSIRTLQEWEQGRRHPSGPALSLLRIAMHHPKAFLQHEDR